MVRASDISGHHAQNHTDRNGTLVFIPARGGRQADDHGADGPVATDSLARKRAG